MQLFITGADGRLGKMLCAAWGKDGLTGLTPVWSSRRGTGSDHIAWDILSGPAPRLAKDCIVLHLAGVLSGNPVALAANADMALRVCDAAKAAGASHIFVASSAAVYGAAQTDHVEVQPPAPLSDYGKSKLDMERKVLCWATNAGSPSATCLRIGNVLGADALFRSANSGQIAILDPVSNQSGGPIRSYIGPRALAQILARLFQQIRDDGTMPSILNVAAPIPISMADLLKSAHRPFQFGPPNPHTIPRVSLSTKRLAGLVQAQAATAATMVEDWRSLLAATK